MAQPTYPPFILEAINQRDPLPSPKVSRAFAHVTNLYWVQTPNIYPTKVVSPCEALNQDEICYHKHTPCYSYKVSMSSPSTAFCVQKWQKGPRHIDWHKVQFSTLSIPVCLVGWLVGLSCHPDINVTMVWSRFNT
jgi:hypothetical protein